MSSRLVDILLDRQSRRNSTSAPADSAPEEDDAFQAAGRVVNSGLHNTSRIIFIAANVILGVVVIICVIVFIKYRRKLTGAPGASSRPGTKRWLMNLISCCGLCDCTRLGRYLGIMPYNVRTGPVKIKGLGVTANVFVEFVTALNPVMTTRVKDVGENGEVIFSDQLEMLVAKKDGDMVIRVKV